MAAKKNIHAQFFRQRVSPVRAFAGDVGVHALGGGLLQIRAGAAGDNADALADFLAAGNHFRRHAGRALQGDGKIVSRNAGPRFEADGFSVARKKRIQIFQAERRSELSVVAELRMRIEWQVRTINREIILDQ